MKKIIILFIGIFLLAACDKYLDEQPLNQIIPESVTDYELLLKDSRIQKTYHFNALMDDDSYIPDANVPSQEYLRAYLWDEYILDGSQIPLSYSSMYQGIATANIVLANIDGATGDDEVQRNKVKGQALALRGCNHFYLVNQYGKHYNPETSDTDLGVALMTELDLEVKPSRASVKEVYDQIVSDLTLAAELLPEFPAAMPDYNYRASKMGVYGFLSRVYLYMGDWQKAEEYGEMVLTNYSFLYNYNDIPGAKERDISTIWSSTGLVRAEMGKSEYNRETLWYKEQLTSSLRSNVFLSSDLLSIIDTNDLTPEVDTKDLRYNIFTSVENGLDKFHSAKMFYRLNTGISVPEVILNVAEAKARLNDIDGSLALVNQLGSNRYMDFEDFTATSPLEALDVVKRERRIEFAFKGFRLFDLKRYIVLGEFDKTITREREGVTYSLAPDSPRYLMPFAQGILELNSNIVQNPR